MRSCQVDSGKYGKATETGSKYVKHCKTGGNTLNYRLQKSPANYGVISTKESEQIKYLQVLARA